MERSIIGDFVGHAKRSPSSTAVRLEGHDLSYGELYALASNVARAIRLRAGEEPRLVAVFANRTVSAFAGVAGALLAGAGYVPINPAFPQERVRTMLEKTGCSVIVAEPAALPALAAALEGSPARFVVIVPEEGPPGGVASLLRGHTLADLSAISGGDLCPVPDVGAADLAYVMFTSGSTGAPKGVMTRHANVRWIIGVLQERYRITQNDRFSLNAEMTFSASVLIMFLAFGAGATICCPTKKDLLAPGKFIVENGITVWKCVPSLAVFMERTHQLRDGAFPSVRITTFGGETVPVDVVQRWRRAAPRSIIENVYGSTELSVNTTYYPWDPLRSPREVFRDSVPIGYPLPGAEVCVCDEQLREVPPGETGELLVAGPLVTAGYIGEEERTAAAYCALPGRAGRFFRTGDIVARPRADEPLIFRGRRDNQIKVLGNRVELGEVEAIGKRVLGTPEVVALGWPPSVRGYDALEVFIGGVTSSEVEVHRTLRRHLPSYMMPRRIRLLERLPLNASGKLDRLALRRMLENEKS